MEKLAGYEKSRKQVVYYQANRTAFMITTIRLNLIQVYRRFTNIHFGCQANRSEWFWIFL